MDSEHKQSADPFTPAREFQAERFARKNDGETENEAPRTRRRARKKQRGDTSGGTASSSSVFEHMKRRAEENQSADEMAPPSHESSVSREADYASRVWLTALGTLEPLLRSTIARPGSGETVGDRISSLKPLIRESDSLAYNIAHSLQENAFDPWAEKNRWSLRKILRMASESVGFNWERHETADHRPILGQYQFVIEGLSENLPGKGEPERAHESTGDLFAGFIKEVASESGNANEHFTADAKARLQLSLLESMRPVINEINRFAFFQDRKQLSHDAANRVAAGAIWLFNKQSSPAMTADGRLTLLQGSLRHAGDLYSKAWATCATQALNRILAANSEEEREQAKSAIIAEGNPLELVQKHFDRSAGYLASAAEAASDHIQRALNSRLEFKSSSAQVGSPPGGERK
ncbi:MULTISPECIES: hypothetical protein [unclassified Thioalkalivibrio]|uniref:hypothetical protein n=1 Tax=unclassified Thioalkalivibrio TaxID=2621013 RepID=UPI0003641830|nr:MULTISPECIES: hypothetical protein [unclassified Thioalkalivibrio]